MKSSSLIFLVVLTFLLAVPLAAQTSDEGQPPSTEASATAQVSAEVPTPTDPNLEASTSTEVQAPDVKASADVTASADVDASTDDQPSTEEKELPKTASPLALLALLGLGGSGAAAGLRRARRR